MTARLLKVTIGKGNRVLSEGEPFSFRMINCMKKRLALPVAYDWRPRAHNLCGLDSICMLDSTHVFDTISVRCFVRQSSTTQRNFKLHNLCRSSGAVDVKDTVKFAQRLFTTHSHVAGDILFETRTDDEKMTIIVSNVSVCYTFFRERKNGRIRSWL